MRYNAPPSALREEIWDKDHPNTASRVDMRRHDVRMATFSEGSLEWPRKVPSAEQLARVGLYYLGVEDRVCCFSCSVELEEWEGEENPLLRHYLASKHCSFLLQDFPEQLSSFRQQSLSQQAQCYANTSLRLHSFAQWPLSDIVTSYQLASVGFYYTGEGSKVICFSCGLVVREWRRGDVPLLVHCRTNPDCQFVKGIIKGAPDSAPAPTPVLKTLPSGVTNKPDFSDFQIRLKSFKKLSPAFPIPRETLSETGLFLLRLPDVMKCHKCDVVVQDWMEGDTAVEKHRGASPDCPFLAEWFPSKLSQQFDPDDLPAAQFNEQELEMMAHPSLASLPSHLPHSSLSLTQPTSLPVESFASLSLSSSHAPHTHTLTESHPPSLPSPQPLSLSATLPSLTTSTSAYHSMTQPHTSSSSSFSVAGAQSTSSYSSPPETLLSSGQPSMEPYATTPPGPPVPTSLSAEEPWGRTVSLPPSYTQTSTHPLETATQHQVYSVCNITMDCTVVEVSIKCGVHYRNRKKLNV